MKRNTYLAVGLALTLTLTGALSGCSVWPADGAAGLYPDGPLPETTGADADLDVEWPALDVEGIEDMMPPLAVPPGEDDELPQPPALAPIAKYPAADPAAPSLGDGGHALRYGSSLYYYAEDPNTSNGALPYALYAAAPDDDGQPWRLFNAYYRGELWAGGGYVFTSNFARGQLSVYRVNVATGEVVTLLAGYLERVDVPRARLIYTRTQGTEAGLYACDYEGGEEQRLYQGVCTFLGMVDSIVYFSVRQGKDILLYATGLNGGETNLIATENSASDNMLTLHDIWQFGVCGGWLFYSFGATQDNGAYFTGDFVRISRDGSDRESFNLTDSESFFTADGWLYYNYYKTGEAGDAFGIYRALPDLSQRQLLGQAGDTLLRVTETQLYFERSGADGTADLYRSDLDGKNPVLLFEGAPVAQETDYFDYETYTSVDPAGDWVFFSVAVNAFTAGDDWRGHTLLSRTVRVPNTGGDAVPLGEQWGK